MGRNKGMDDNQGAFDPGSHRMIAGQRWFEDFELGERLLIGIHRKEKAHA